MISTFSVMPPVTTIMHGQINLLLKMVSFHSTPQRFSSIPICDDDITMWEEAQIGDVWGNLNLNLKFIIFLNQLTWTWLKFAHLLSQHFMMNGEKKVQDLIIFVLMYWFILCHWNIFKINIYTYFFKYVKLDSTEEYQKSHMNLIFI